MRAGTLGVKPFNGNKHKAICTFPKIFLLLRAGIKKMMQESVNQALNRIEVALGKLEAKRSVLFESSDASALRTAHENLKADTRAVMSDIDQLLATLES